MYHIGPEVSVKEHPVLYKAYCCMWLLQYFSKVLEQLSLYVIHFHEYLCLYDGFDCNLACNSHCWTLRFYSFTQSHTGVDESKHFKCFFFFERQFTHCCSWISRKTQLQCQYWDVNRFGFEEPLQVETDVDWRALLVLRGRLGLVVLWSASQQNH